MYLILLLLLAVGSSAVILTGRGTWFLEGLAQRYVNRERRNWGAACEEAEKLAKAGRLRDAEAELESLLERLPPMRNRRGYDGIIRSRALRQLAKIYERQDRRRSAMRAYEELISLNLAGANGYALYGRALLGLGREKEGEKLLLKSLEMNPCEVIAAECLVNRYCEKGLFEQALNVHRRYEDAFYMMGRGSVNLMDNTNVISSFEFRPVVDGQLHEYTLPIGRFPEARGSVDALSMILKPGPVCGHIEIQSVIIWPYRQVPAVNWKPIKTVTNFAHATFKGLTRKPDKAGSFSCSNSGMASLRLSLGSVPIAVEDMDVIIISMTAHKRVSPEWSKNLEKARIAVKRDQLEGRMGQ